MQVSSRGSRIEPAPSELARLFTGFFRFMTVTTDGPFLQQVTDLDLSLGQLKLLWLLYELPAESGGEFSVKELAEHLGISLPTASRALDPLVKRRLVARREDADDRRIKRVRLTARGETVVARLLAARIVAFENVLGLLSESEREKLVEALEEISARPEISRHVPRERVR
jgi:DNA-binding MarR family transcriptional regulator